MASLSFMAASPTPFSVALTPAAVVPPNKPLSKLIFCLLPKVEDPVDPPPEIRLGSKP